MLIIHGKRTARIKRYTDNNQACRDCQSFDLDVRVYRDYYHFFFIPIFPVGDKVVKMRCKNCGEPIRINTIQSHYEDISRTPFYLYTFPILFVCLIIIVIIGNLSTQKEKAIFIDNPKVGDVYRISKDENNKTTYYFLRLARVNGDTVIAYHNNLEYNGFIYKLNDDDFFVKEDKLYFMKHELKQMLEKEEINSVERNYDDDKGFNRIK
jgi:hypothetical protein